MSSQCTQCKGVRQTCSVETRREWKYRNVITKNVFHRKRFLCDVYGKWITLSGMSTHNSARVCTTSVIFAKFGVYCQNTIILAIDSDWLLNISI